MIQCVQAPRCRPRGRTRRVYDDQYPSCPVPNDQWVVGVEPQDRIRPVPQPVSAGRRPGNDGRRDDRGRHRMAALVRAARGATRRRIVSLLARGAKWPNVRART